MLHVAAGAQRVLQVRIDLEDFSLELGRAHIDEGRRHGFEVRVAIVEGDTSRAQRIFVLVGVDACNNDGRFAGTDEWPGRRLPA